MITLTNLIKSLTRGQIEKDEQIKLEQICHEYIQKSVANNKAAWLLQTHRTNEPEIFLPKLKKQGFGALIDILDQHECWSLYNLVSSKHHTPGGLDSIISILQFFLAASVHINVLNRRSEFSQKRNEASLNSPGFVLGQSTISGAGAPLIPSANIHVAFTHTRQIERLIATNWLRKDITPSEKLSAVMDHFFPINIQYTWIFTNKEHFMLNFSSVDTALF